MVTPKDLRNVEEDADVLGSIRRHADELAKRGEANKETRERAERVASKAGDLLLDVHALRDHIERNEDIA